MVTRMHSIKTAFGRFFIACFLCVVTAHAAEIAIGRSVRPHDVDISARWGFVEAEYIAEGEQPYGIPNRNRVINLDVVLSHRFGQWEPYIKAGVSCSRFGFNGSGNDYRNRTGFTWQNIGAGATYWLAPRIGLRAQTVWMRYQQVDIPAFETFTYSSASLVFDF